MLESFDDNVLKIPQRYERLYIAIMTAIRGFELNEIESSTLDKILTAMSYDIDFVDLQQGENYGICPIFEELLFYLCRRPDGLAILNEIKTAFAA